jgi:thioredoxin 2
VPDCDTVNLLPVARLNEQPMCGQCQRRLFEGHPLELTAAGFDKQVSGSDIA